MIIVLKNKHTLQVDGFSFKCSIGKNGLSKRKVEGDKKTPIGNFGIGNLYFRKDRVNKPETDLKCVEISRNMAWCDDVNYPKKYNFDNPVVGQGSAIFIHLTKDYKPTAGCIALIKKDFLIMLRLIRKNSKIKII